MLQIGKPAPDFNNIMAYQNGDFTTISMKDFKKSWIILFFYPRDFTFICPTEIKGFAKMEKEFNDLNCKIVAASTDSHWAHKNWFEKDLPEVKYPILADTTQQLSRDYGVLNSDDGSSERGLFIIDDTGTLRYVVISSGSVGRSVKETLRVVKALQSGELCPVEWEPGEGTLGKA